MLKEFEGRGKTLEEARNTALIGLNAPASADVHVEVVQMPKKKVLGLFGGSDAVVKVSYDDGKRKRSPSPAAKHRRSPKSRRSAATSPKRQRSRARPVLPRQTSLVHLRRTNPPVHPKQINPERRQPCSLATQI